MKRLNITVLNTTKEYFVLATSITLRVKHSTKYCKGTQSTTYRLDDQRSFRFTKIYQQIQRDVAGWWYLIELRKILVRKLLATWTSVSDGIVRDVTTSTILALMGGEWREEKKKIKKREDMITLSIILSEAESLRLTYRSLAHSGITLGRCTKQNCLILNLKYKPNYHKTTFEL